jgi:hypothetical protein
MNRIHITMNRISIRICLAPLLVAAALLTGCAQIKLGAPVPNIDNIQKAKSSGMAPVAVGEFALAAGKPAGLDKGVSVRSNTVSSPFDESFAKYLKETLSAELKAAGLLDPASPVAIIGELTDSQIDAAIGTGQGSLAARFKVNRAGQTTFDKEFRVASSWDSSFVGGVAIPRAVNEYSALYRQLVGKLLDDPQFRAAVGKP